MSVPVELLTGTKPFAVCPTKVNLGFVLDSSKTTNGKFGKQKELVASIVDGFVIKEQGSKVALIT